MTNQTTPNKRGGSRPNAGRNTEIQEEVTKITATLDEMTLRKAKVLGSGNVSKGLRVAVLQAFEAYQKGRFDIES